MLNLTPHAVDIANEQGEVVATIERSGQVARVGVKSVPVGELELGGVIVPTFTNVYEEVQGMPEDKTQKVLVSAMVLARLGSEYKGIAFAPDTGKTAVRNEQGHIVAVRGFVTVE